LRLRREDDGGLGDGRKRIVYMGWRAVFGVLGGVVWTAG